MGVLYPLLSPSLCSSCAVRRCNRGCVFITQCLRTITKRAAAAASNPEGMFDDLRTGSARHCKGGCTHGCWVHLTILIPALTLRCVRRGHKTHAADGAGVNAVRGAEAAAAGCTSHPETLHPMFTLRGMCMQVIKRTLQTALVWTLYEELQPRLLGAATRLRERQQPAHPRRPP